MTLTLPPLSNRTRGCGRDDDACVRTREARGAPRPFLPPPFFFSFPFLPPPSSPPPIVCTTIWYFFIFLASGGKTGGGRAGAPSPISLLSNTKGVHSWEFVLIELE